MNKLEKMQLKYQEIKDTLSPEMDAEWLHQLSALEKYTTDIERTQKALNEAQQNYKTISWSKIMTKVAEIEAHDFPYEPVDVAEGRDSEVVAVEFSIESHCVRINVRWGAKTFIEPVFCCYFNSKYYTVPEDIKISNYASCKKEAVCAAINYWNIYISEKLYEFEYSEELKRYNHLKINNK